MSDRPRIGVSSCLLGERVRYDGGDKRDAWLVDELGPRVEWVPVCPEVEAGFGTPREPMQLERRGGRMALVTVESGRDVTDVLSAFAERRTGELAAASLDGYVFKAGSPSCGVDGVRGLFADAVMQRLPDLPAVDERQLADPAARGRFVERVFARFRDRRRLEAGGSRPVDVVRMHGGARQAIADRAAVEEPLEIRLHGRPFAVIMRTPGADRELAAGFLLSERIIRDADDLGTVEHCTLQPSATANIVNVTLTDQSGVERAIADRRDVTANASCGLCGRRTIDTILADVGPVRAAWTLDVDTVRALPQRLREAQAVFDETGGLHAAGLFDRHGRLVDAAEDVGRHNAVDKIVGRMLMREALPLSDHALCVSGRTSFEILQKAAVAGIPIVVAVSAPSTLAIDLAGQCGITLAGFVRGDGLNIYSHASRIR